MGKASRMKKERRQAPPPVGNQAAALPQRAVLLGTVGVVVAIGIVVGVLVATRSSPKAPPPASSAAADTNAPAALVKAANAVNFQPSNVSSFGARGGVYIAGGIAPRFPEFLAASAFRARFEAKGRFQDYLRNIPTRLVTKPDASFVGLKMFAEHNQP